MHTEDGELWKITGNDEDLHSGGRLCTRGTGGPGAYLDPDRLKTPLMRVTVDGRQTFQPVSWDEALDYIADKMRSIAAEHGPEKMLMLNHGAGSSHFRHLLRAYGSDSHAEPAFAQCRGPRDVGFRLTFGESASSPAMRSMLAGSVTSSRTTSEATSASSAASPGFLAVPMTRQPAAAYRRASSRPMPRLAPVIRTVGFLSSMPCSAACVAVPAPSISTASASRTKKEPW